MRKPETKEQKNMLDKVRAYCAKADANILSICAALGYSSTSTVSQWFSRKRIPHKAMYPLNNFFKGVK